MRKSIAFVMVLIVGLTLVEVNAATMRQSSQGTGRGNGGIESCRDRCDDHYVECQRETTEGSLDRTLCDQRLERCAQWCEVVYEGPLATDATEVDAGDVLTAVGDVNGMRCPTSRRGIRPKGKCSSSQGRTVFCSLP
jgi:hypothetical protein